MELTNEFSVSVPVDEAWSVLIDLERVAPCMPGFQLQEVEGDEYRGVVKVKVGPMTAQYKGVATFQERDETNHRAVVRAEGRETRGQGSAAATVTATLEPADGGTRVTMRTDLTITGKVAQFGRGVLADVSRKLIGDFVKALEADVLSGASGGGAPATAAPRVDGGPGTEDVEVERAAAAGPRRVASASSEPVDLLAAAGPSVARRAGLAVIALAVVVALIWLLAR